MLRASLAALLLLSPLVATGAADAGWSGAGSGDGGPWASATFEIPKGGEVVLFVLSEGGGPGGLGVLELATEDGGRWTSTFFGGSYEGDTRVYADLGTGEPLDLDLRPMSGPGGMGAALGFGNDGEETFRFRMTILIATPDVESHSWGAIARGTARILDAKGGGGSFWYLDDDFDARVTAVHGGPLGQVASAGVVLDGEKRVAGKGALYALFTTFGSISACSEFTGCVTQGSNAMVTDDLSWTGPDESGSGTAWLSAAAPGEYAFHIARHAHANPRLDVWSCDVFCGTAQAMDDRVLLAGGFVQHAEFKP